MREVVIIHWKDIRIEIEKKARIALDALGIKDISVVPFIQVVAKGSRCFQEGLEAPSGLTAEECLDNFIPIDEDNCILLILHQHNYWALDLYERVPWSVPVMFVTGGGDKPPDCLRPSDAFITEFGERKINSFIERWWMLGGGALGREKMKAAAEEVFYGKRSGLSAIEFALETLEGLSTLLDAYRVISSECAQDRKWMTETKACAENAMDCGKALRGTARERLIRSSDDAEAEDSYWFHPVVESLKRSGLFSREMDRLIEELISGHQDVEIQKVELLHSTREGNLYYLFGILGVLDEIDAKGTMKTSFHLPESSELSGFFVKVLYEIDAVRAAFCKLNMTGGSDKVKTEVFDESKIKYAKERARLSHDRIQNQFLASIAYDAEIRSSSNRDLKLGKALQGDMEYFEVIRSAFFVWNETCHEIESFLSKIPQEYGYRVTKMYDKEAARIRSCLLEVTGFGERFSNRTASLDEIKSFWSAMDKILDFFENLKCNQERYLA